MRFIHIIQFASTCLYKTLPPSLFSDNKVNKQTTTRQIQFSTIIINNIIYFNVKTSNEVPIIVFLSLLPLLFRQLEQTALKCRWCNMKPSLTENVLNLNNRRMFLHILWERGRISCDGKVFRCCYSKSFEC